MNMHPENIPDGWARLWVLDFNGTWYWRWIGVVEYTTATAVAIARYYGTVAAIGTANPPHYQVFNAQGVQVGGVG